jgi:hypothetical protein
MLQAPFLEGFPGPEVKMKEKEPNLEENEADEKYGCLTFKPG